MLRGSSRIDFIRVAFFHAQDENIFLAHKLGKQLTFWQISAHKFGLNFDVEIEQRIFLPNTVCRHLFALLVKLTTGIFRQRPHWFRLFLSPF